MNKKNFNYLYSLLILNNINAGCKKKSGKEDKENKENKTISNNSQLTDPLTKNKDDNEENKQETEEEKKKRLAEEEKKKKEKLEKERLNKIASEVRKFFNVLNKVYVNNKTNEGKTEEIIKIEIVEDKIKEFIKYLEHIDFSKDVQKNDLEILTKLLSIVKIENCNEDLKKFHDDLKNNIGNDVNTNNLCENSKYFKCFKQLFSLGDKTDYNFLIIKDKLDNKIYFAIKDNDGKNITINNKRYDIIQLMFNTFFVDYLKPSTEEKDKISDEKMNFTLNLGYNYLINFEYCFNYFDQILAHIGNPTNTLPTNVTLAIYKSSGENIEQTCKYIWAGDYNFSYSKGEVDVNNLYNFQNIIKINVDKDYKLSFTTEKGKKQMKVNNFKNTPFEISTMEKIVPILEKLKDFTKIDEVKNELLELVKHDKIYKGQNISSSYITSGNINFSEFKKEDIKNSTFPYNFNIYIYNDNNETKVDIKKLEDNERNKKFIELINNFEKNLENLFGKLTYDFNKIVLLIKNIEIYLKKSNLDQIININFSGILSNEEWDKLDTNNLCIKIANDLSSIELGKNIEKADNFKVFSLNKQEKVSSPGDTKFKSQEKK